MKHPAITTRRLAPLFCILTLAGSLARAAPQPADGEDAKNVDLTVLQIWASDAPDDGSAKPPKVLKKYLKALEKSTGKKRFLLHGKPIVKTLAANRPFQLPLPQGYRAMWELKRPPEGKSPAHVRQRLVNPKKKGVEVLLKKRPVIQELPRIHQGGDTFVLLVDFTAAKKKR